MTLSRLDLELVVFEGKSVVEQWRWVKRACNPQEMEAVRQAVREVVWANDQILKLG